MMSEIPVELALTPSSQPTADTDVVIVPVRTAESGDRPFAVDTRDLELLAGWGVDLARRLGRHRATGARGELVLIDLEAECPKQVIAVGLGNAGGADLRKAAAAVSRRLRGASHALDLVARDLDEQGLQSWAEGLLLGAWSYSMASRPARPPVARVSLVNTGSGAPSAVHRAVARSGATALARRLIHTPPNIKDPQWLADQAVAVAGRSGLEVRVWDADELRESGFGGIVAVGSGSARPPLLVQMQYRPVAAEQHVVLVGKGITFDSGGLSLKKPDMQVNMKTDMTGAAVVCAVMSVVSRLAPAGIAVTGLLCLAENLPGGRAVRPGDVVQHFGGITSEVRNTDAEGRLVLADGLAYAAGRLDPDVLVDIATLTGAATLGLGRRYGALYATTDALAGGLLAAGERSGEQLWRMPLYEGYAASIRSQVADQANADVEPGPGPGSITAALFLGRFTGGVDWAHMDIAGPGRSDAEREELPKGGTGFGTRALLSWIEAGAPH